MGKANEQPIDPHRFQPTRWTIVLAAREEAEGAGQAGASAALALEALCQAYWQPLYAFVRRRGYSRHDAEDLTQAFFATLLEGRALKSLKREGGRFRSFLLTAMKRFLAHERERALAKKRGGDRVVLSLDAEAFESRLTIDPAMAESADHVYQRQWAQTVLDRVLDRLREEYESSGKGAWFDQMASSLSRPRGEVPYDVIAERLETTEAAIKMAVRRLRDRYRRLLREEIAETVAEPAEIDDELQALFAAYQGN